jgi:capsular polysaccharide biosynthesis protein
MEHQLDILLEQFLSSYPNALGVTFHSMELPIIKASGSHVDILEKYKDIPMMSIYESFNTSFSFIVTEKGSIVIFFIDQIHFISVFTESLEPNKELANRMYESFNEKFKTAIELLK